MCYKMSMQIQIQLALFLLFVAGHSSACQTQGPGKRSTRCILPPYPENGRYEVAGDPGAKPGDDPEYVYLNVSCDRGYGVVGNNVALCVQGEWSTAVPLCVRVCYLQESPSVTHFCNRAGVEGFVSCGEYEPLETTVKPECRAGYYSPSAMPWMRCVDGAWTNVAQCTPECGLLGGNGSTLPWSVLIYKKKQDLDSLYQQLCLGSIISPNIVISAAHCFSDPDTKMDDAKYMVVVGLKQYRDTKKDEKFPVKDVKITDRFQGFLSNFQHDLALVILSRAFIYSVTVRPICLDFDYTFKKEQLQEGNLGTVAVLPFPRKETKEFEIQRIPYIPIRKCIEKSPSAFREYITGDKFCAGRDNDTKIYRGSSGTGLAFPEARGGVVRYFLQGLASVAPPMEPEGTPTDFVLFTEIYNHKDFIQENLATSLPPQGGSLEYEAL